MDSDNSELDCDQEYETCCAPRSSTCGLPFDPSSLEDLILMISDKFDFRVIINDSRAKGALMVTTGLTLAGSIIGKHYGGKIGAALGGAVGGVCGLGITAVTMREIWMDIKSKLSELFDIVYDYIAGLGLEDYKKAAIFLTSNSTTSVQLGMLIVEVASSILGQKILSSISAAV